MRIQIAPHPVGVPDDLGAPDLPTSKSHAQRVLCLAKYLPGEFLVDGVPPARDVQVLRTALSQADTATLDLQDNGTALRILAVLPAMLGLECHLTGDDRLRQRPLAAAVEFLQRYGATASEQWPRHFDGRGAEFPAELEVDASLTSQVATGVLLGAAARMVRFDTAHLVRIHQPSAPDYLIVTLNVLDWFGFQVTHWWDGDDMVVEFQQWTQPPDGHRISIPLDASSFSFFAAFLAMHGRKVEQTLGDQDPHPDWLFCDDLRRLLEAEPNTELTFRELRHRPDTFPCLVTLAAMRCGTTIITDVPSLRHKESDRIAAMVQALQALDVPCKELPDGIQVTGPVPVHDEPAVLPTPDDHRIVMALALLGTRMPNGVELSNPMAIEKSWPGYFEWLGRVSQVTILDGNAV